TGGPSMFKTANTLKLAIAATFFGLFSIGMPGNALAGTDAPIEIVTRNYREAVKDFERAVFRSRHYEGPYERLADALEDASGRLRDAGRRWTRTDRLIQRFQEAQVVHAQTSAVFFGPSAIQPCPITYAQLAQLWQVVDYQFRLVQLEIQQVFSGGYPAAIPAGGFNSPGFCPTGNYSSLSAPLPRQGLAVQKYYGGSVVGIPSFSASRFQSVGNRPISSRPLYRDRYFGNQFGIGADLYR
ncbi:MAG: hypothetical protein AAF664_18240, partial [Planctomycetota bacterium]